MKQDRLIPKPQPDDGRIMERLTLGRPAHSQPIPQHRQADTNPYFPGAQLINPFPGVRKSNRASRYVL